MKRKLEPTNSVPVLPVKHIAHSGVSPPLMTNPAIPKEIQRKKQSLS